MDVVTTWLITREFPDARVECARLEAVGIHGQPLPCIETRPLPWPWPDAPATTWTMFTSANAVESWVSGPQPSLGTIAATRSAATRLRKAGVEVELEINGGTVALANALLRHARWSDSAPQPRVVRYPTSKLGMMSQDQNETVRLLRPARVDRKAAYDVFEPETLRAAPLPDDYALVFFSPSAVSHFLAAKSGESAPRHVVCFGFSTFREWNMKRPAPWPVAHLTSDVSATLLEVTPP